MTAVAAASPYGRRMVRAVRLGGVASAATVAAAAVVAIVLCAATGASPLVVLSGSMEPAIATGDLIIVREARIGTVNAGDIVTFRDEERAGDLVTHRVVSIDESDTGFDVVTRGDRNTAAEAWSVGRTATVGAFVLRVPWLGFVAGWAAHPGVLIQALLGAAAVILLRLIWLR